jgi:hypothetical protein
VEKMRRKGKKGKRKGKKENIGKKENKLFIF